MASLISHEKDVFRKHFGALTQCLTQQEDLIPLVMQFYSEGIIGDELRNHILDTGSMNAQQKSAKFLTAVERYIADKPGSIEVVIQLFMSSSTCKYVAETMQVDMVKPLETLEHESPKLSERKVAYERYSKLRQISLPEHVLHDSKSVLQKVNSFEQGTSITQPELLQSPNGQQLPKQASFPPYHSDLVTTSATPQFSQLSLRNRSGTFPIDVHSPSPTSQEKLLPLSVTEPSISKSLSSSPPSDRNDKSRDQIASYQPSVNSCTPNNVTSSTTVTAARHQEGLVSTQPPSVTQDSVHLQCEVMNAKTRKTIKCSSSSGQSHPLLRSIKLKVKKYDTVAPYTPLQLNLSASQSCYVYIINIGSAGDQTVLVPNEFEENNYLEAGKVMMFPSSTAGYEFELDENCGMETIVLMAYQSHLESCDQAIGDCGAFRNGSVQEEMPAELHRGIKVKPKQQHRHKPIGFLEIQFAVSESR